jgi:hypothetical protein
MTEIQKFYKVILSKDVNAYTFTFRADNLLEAIDHAAHVAWVDGYDVIGKVTFIGREEPTDNGDIVFVA